MSQRLANGDTWDPRWLSVAGQALVYSDNNRTATAHGASYVQNLTPQTSGRWYGELTVSYSGPASDAYRVGLAGNTSPASQQFASHRLGEDARSIAWTPLGNLTEGWEGDDAAWTGASWVSRAPAYQSSDLIGIAADFDIGRVWFRVNGGAWADERNSADGGLVADPVSTIGGADISRFGADPIYLAVMLPTGGAVSLGVLSEQLPIGFLPWLNPRLPRAAGAATLALPQASGRILAGDYVATSAWPGAVLARPAASAALYQFNPANVRFAIDRAGAQARVNIFDMPVVVHLVLTESQTGAPVRMNYPINHTDFNLIRGAPNVIQFFVRDVDRHVVTGPLTNATLTVNIIDTSAGVVLMQRDLITIDAAQSLYALATQPVDLLDWPTGPLRYNVLVRRADGTQSLLWTDRNYTPYGVCRLLDGPLPNPEPSILLDPASFVAQDGYSYSSAVPGAAAKGYPDGLQTFVFYTTGFIGNVAIQASLVEQPSTETQNWFDVATVSFNDPLVIPIVVIPIVGPTLPLVPIISSLSNVTAVNVAGNFLWLRVAVQNTEPLTYPVLPVLPPPLGSVDQILYRN